MRISTALLLPIVAEAASVFPRQMGSSLKLVRTKKLEPEVREKAIHVVQQAGPITLKGKGSSQDSGQQNFMFSIPRDIFCRDCTVLKGHIGLANEKGEQMIPQKNSGIYIHHILTFDTTKRGGNFINSCTNGLGAIVGSKFVGSGEDNNNVPVYYTTKDKTHNGGFHIGANDAFMMNADLVSMNTNTSQIYMTFDMEYLPGKVGEDASETLLTVEACGGSRLRTSTSGPTNSTSGKYTFTQNGKIVLAKGHLHAGGDKMQMFINNKLVCESKAIYGGVKGDAAINEMTICPEITVKTGDVMTFTAIYDVSKHPLRHESHGMGVGMPDVMGMFDIVFSK